MKKLAFVLLVGALISGVAVADSLSVQAGAAMGGTNFGLEVLHDNTSIAYVQDDSPNAERTYRAEFLFAVPSLTKSPGVGFRQTIFTAIGSNPRPGVGLCSPTAAFIEAIRCFHWNRSPTGVELQCFSRGDFCGERNSGDLIDINTQDTNTNGSVRVCIEWVGGVGTDGGSISLGVVDDDEACTAAAMNGNNLTNNDVDVQFVRLGTPQGNFFSASENVTYYFDEFASFRTLAP
ncbi:MAG: hypothetical protein AAGE94_18760 [Acidobacteriota bacterium]